MVQSIFILTEPAKATVSGNIQTNLAEVLEPIDKTERECISKTANTYEMNKCSQIAQKSREKDIQNNLDELKKFYFKLFLNVQHNRHKKLIRLFTIILFV